MKKNIIVGIALILLQIGYSQTTETFFEKADVFFKKYVSNGLIDYRAIKRNPTLLQDLLQMTGQFKIKTTNPAEFQAFYINAYNLSVIMGIVANYPVDSPLKIDGFFDKKMYFIAGSPITLNNIENKMLRENFSSEARFHFVLVCAGLGCPPIIAEAYKPATLEQQLQRQTVKALNDPTFIRVENDKVVISEIFKWYKEDFTLFGSELDYINTYREKNIPTYLEVSYYPYNWALNKK